MNMDKEANFTGQLSEIVKIGRQLASDHQHDVLSQLAILRTLESLHREIRENYFQEALPDNRHGLYSLLLKIEETGGWPYIDRLKLQSLLANLIQEEEPT
jgi:hypothetical protein